MIKESGTYLPSSIINSRPLWKCHFAAALSPRKQDKKFVTSYSQVIIHYGKHFFSWLTFGGYCFRVNCVVPIEKAFSRVCCRVRRPICYNNNSNYCHYTSYSLSVFSMAKSLQLSLEISATYRLVSYLLASVGCARNAWFPITISVSAISLGLRRGW